MKKILTLYQPQNGYCYNSDTHFLYDFICRNLKQFKNIKGDLLDIGSGSGVLGLLVARDFTKLNLHQVEIQKSFQFLSDKNSQINTISNKLYKGSLFEVVFEKQFDYIVSNPPFYNNDVIKSKNKSLKIARYNENMPLDKFINTVAVLLSQKGKFFFCYDVKQLPNIFLIAQKVKLNIEAISYLHPKSTKEASLVMIYLRKNSKSKLKVLNPLIMFDDNGKFKKNIEDIYIKCNTYSIKADI